MYLIKSLWKNYVQQIAGVSWKLSNLIQKAIWIQKIKHSTYMALMIFVDKITKSLGNGEFVIGIFLDFSKAFDNVNHDILLQTLHFYRIRGTAFMWFKSYLSCRYQYVTYNSTESSKNLLSVEFPRVLYWGHCCLLSISMTWPMYVDVLCHY